MVMVLLYIHAAVTALAGQPLVLKCDRQTMTPGETARLTLEIAATTFSDVIPPRVEGITITANPQLRNEVSATLNGVVTKTTVIGYDIQAKEAGTYTIPPFKARVDGQFVSSNSVILDVRTQESLDSKRLSLNDVLQFDAQVPKTAVYEGEAVTVTLALRWHDLLPVPSERQIELDDTPGFYTVQTDWQSVQLPDVRVEGNLFKGKGWRMVLFPTGQGDHTIPTARLAVVAGLPMPGGRFRRDVITLETDPIVLGVKSLPPRPADFSGAVGQYELKAEAADTNATAGVPLPIVVWVAGIGNPNALGTPRFPALDWAQVSDPEKFSQPNATDGGLHVQQRFTYRVVPLQTGAFTVPPITYCFFDPNTETFVTQSVGPFPVQVAAADESDRVMIGNEPESSAAPSAPIERDFGRAIAVSPWGSTARSTIAGLAPVAYAAFAFGLWRRRARARIGHGASHAADHARRLLRQTQDVPDPVQGIYRSLLQYVATRAGESVTGLTSAEAADRMTKQGIPASVRDATLAILNTCERARYTGRSLSDAEVAALRQGAYAAVEALEVAHRNPESHAK